MTDAPAGAVTAESRGAVARTAARGATQLLIARALFVVFGYIVSIILARGLGPREFGVYGVIVSFFAWVEMGTSAGVPSATAKLIPRFEENSREVEQSARFLATVLSLAMVVLAWIFAPRLADFFGIQEGRGLFRVAALNIPLVALYYAYQGILNGHRRFGTQAAAFVIHGFSRVVGIGGIAYLGLTVFGALAVNVCATAAVVLFLVVRFPPRGRPGTRERLAEIIRLAVPMGLYVIALQLLISVDLWSLKALASDSGEEVGIYVAALMLAKTLLIIPPVLSSVLFASLSWALAKGDDEGARRFLREAGRFVCIVLVPACLLIAIDGRGLLTLLYSDVYGEGGRFLRLQVFAFGAFSFLDMYANALLVAGRQKRPAGALIFIIPIAILLNRLLIPAHGPMGAATALLVTILLGTAACSFFAYRRFGPLLPFRSVLRIVAAAGLVALLDTRLPAGGFLLLGKLAFLLLVYAGILVLWKELQWSRVKAFLPWGSR